MSSNSLFSKGKQGIKICLCLGLRHESKTAVHVKDIANEVFGERKEIAKMCEKFVEEGYLIRELGTGRSYSYRLGLDPEQIFLGNIVRICEPDFHLTDCKIAKYCKAKEYCYFDKRLWGSLEVKLLEMLNQISLKNYLDNMYEVAHIAPEKCHLSQLTEE
jgi:DNA-binding IscR family transcriptional regulator